MVQSEDVSDLIRYIALSAPHQRGHEHVDWEPRLRHGAEFGLSCLRWHPGVDEVPHGRAP